MLISITCILFSGMFFGFLCKKIKFPSLFGMILAGILIGPYVLDLIDDSILNISAEIRKIALIIILIRAGLKLSFEDLKKVGRPAILMCFVPAVFEVFGMLLLAPRMLGLTLREAAILGAVVGAVSPAVIVPRMIKLIDEGYGTKKAIPQMILAGASVDDVFVIVLFTTFTSLAKGERVHAGSFVKIPISIVTGIAVGLLVGYILVKYFENVHIRDSVKLLIILGVTFSLTFAEDIFGKVFPFASLISVMALGLMIKRKNRKLAVRLSLKFDKLWVPAELFLFVLVGASVAIDSLRMAGVDAVILILLVLVFRMLGVWICLIHTKLRVKERLFCMLAYTPKATVQAAIGGLPLAMGLSCGEIVLTVSVVAILLTAPLGAFAIDLTYNRYLEKKTNEKIN
ncbi:MAG: cation:proton antiporter [Eubacteriales bacterium]|nr:cation:proton antiporter [Lachnospiraceae bacterium]MDO5127599.1 cation:proton antiporter [Eubacteriales bacterium]